ncbi:MAG: LysR family transcriptional regulator [Cyclobacteriaceae bacterium]|nr:LysR family transcriptional regulator [Cyclobacteriaceae bacterium HetDA_MAG_MS6]
MHYTLHQLKIFRKISETKSITRAAEQLYLTQPAVSIQLKKLQEQFDIPLTEVVGRKLYITDFGQEIASASDRILKEAELMESKTLAYKGHLVGALKISVVSTGKYVMPYFLADFLSSHPGIDLIMDVTNKAAVVQSLEVNEVDFALVSVLPDHLQIDKEVLMDNKLFLVKSEANQQSVETFPMIYREEGSATRRAMEHVLKDSSLPGQKKIELTSNEAVKQAVIAGLGQSIMPVIGIKNELESGALEIVHFPGLPVTTSWNLIWLKSKNLSPIAQAYIEYLRAEKHKIIDEHFAWHDKY